jgi:endonuclease-3
MGNVGLAMRDGDIGRVVGILREESAGRREQAVTEVSRDRDPFKVLVSTLISLRTKDEVTRKSSERLFKLADTPESMAKLEASAIEKAIYPAGFYRTKAKHILAMCSALLRDHGGSVPDEIEELLSLPGVGRKTANLVVTLGYGKPGICVDTHVHRIVNRLGYVRTGTPEETERSLRAKLPRRYWIEINDLLVTYGQHVCTPVSPFCSRCRLAPFCGRVGVTRSR